MALPATAHEAVINFWTIFTYMFTHLDFWHLLINCLWLAWFGSLLCEIAGARHVMTTYIGGGIAGAIMYVTFNTGFFPTSDACLIGASAATLGVIRHFGIRTRQTSEVGIDGDIFPTKTCNCRSRRVSARLNGDGAVANRRTYRRDNCGRNMGCSMAHIQPPEHAYNATTHTQEACQNGADRQSATIRILITHRC